MAEEAARTMPRRNAEQRRESILAAARRLFALQGFHGTGVAQIARESDVLVGQIYRDFASKEDLIAALVERDLLELLADPELADAASIDDPGRRLRDWVIRFVTRKVDDDARRLVADIVSEATRNSRIAAILEQAHVRLRQRFETIATVWAPEPERIGDRQAIADFILTISGGVLHRRICGLDTNDDSVMTRMTELIDAEITQLQGPT